MQLSVSELLLGRLIIHGKEVAFWFLAAHTHNSFLFFSLHFVCGFFCVLFFGGGGGQTDGRRFVCSCGNVRRVYV